MPGCPPTPALLNELVQALLAGTLPPKGTVLGPDVAQCEQCPREATRPTDLKLTELRRLDRSGADPETCFLAQGILCMGPATRGGCEARCIAGNMPCTGCFGPTSRVLDQGAKMLSALAASVDAREDEAIKDILNQVADPVGTLYRYGLAKSLLRGSLISQRDTHEVDGK